MCVCTHRRVGRAHTDNCRDWQSRVEADSSRPGADTHTVVPDAGSQLQVRRVGLLLGSFGIVGTPGEACWALLGLLGLQIGLVGEDGWLSARVADDATRGLG